MQRRFHPNRCRLSTHVSYHHLQAAPTARSAHQECTATAVQPLSARLESSCASGCRSPHASSRLRCMLERRPAAGCNHHPLSASSHSKPHLYHSNPTRPNLTLPAHPSRCPRGPTARELAGLLRARHHGPRAPPQAPLTAGMMNFAQHCSVPAQPTKMAAQIPTVADTVMGDGGPQAMAFSAAAKTASAGCCVDLNLESGQGQQRLISAIHGPAQLTCALELYYTRKHCPPAYTLSFARPLG
eukprot:SAG25_NODE_1307_length_3347_cov_1.871613_2_plen_242_part_00